MKSFDPDDEHDRKSLARLNAAPWMVAQLALNPSYLGWGPGEDYMTCTGSEHSWQRSREFTWAEFDLELDDYNEVVHFYFELDREGRGCPQCPEARGLSPRAAVLSDQWYGKAPFDAAAYGAKPLALTDPALLEAAREQVKRSPEYYGTGEPAIAREALRLHRLWSACWSHQLKQEDVDALIDADRLWDFTRKPLWPGQETFENGWTKEPNGYRPTADEVNEWSMRRALGHDGINAAVCLEARCKREGIPYLCANCEGHGYEYTVPVAHLNLVIWVLHPRKGASRGFRITHIPQDGLARVYGFLDHAAKRNAERFNFISRAFAAAQDSQPAAVQ